MSLDRTYITSRLSLIYGNTRFNQITKSQGNVSRRVLRDRWSLNTGGHMGKFMNGLCKICEIRVALVLQTFISHTAKLTYIIPIHIMFIYNIIYW